MKSPKTIMKKVLHVLHTAVDPVSHMRFAVFCSIVQLSPELLYKLKMQNWSSSSRFQSTEGFMIYCIWFWCTSTGQSCLHKEIIRTSKPQFVLKTLCHSSVSDGLTLLHAPINPLTLTASTTWLRYHGHNTALYAQIQLFSTGCTSDIKTGNIKRTNTCISFGLTMGRCYFRWDLNAASFSSSSITAPAGAAPSRWGPPAGARWSERTSECCSGLTDRSLRTQNM